MKESKHPMQPILISEDGRTGFKENAIVSFLYNWSASRGMGLNELAMMPFSQEDREQFAQLIGYSISGFSELSYVSDETMKMVEQAEKEVKTESKKVSAKVARQ